MTAARLPRSFFDRPAVAVARDLLGKRLVKIDSDGTRLTGLIVETEAYGGADDLACHARAGRTRRNASMWGPPGHAYVYFTYGMHWLLNLVADEDGSPAAALIRAFLPLEGVDRMRARRGGRRRADLADGPAKLAQALGIDGAWDGCDLCSEGSTLFVEIGPPVRDSLVVRSTRVGIDRVPEPWRSQPWRFRAPLPPEGTR